MGNFPVNHSGLLVTFVRLLSDYLPWGFRHQVHQEHRPCLLLFSEFIFFFFILFSLAYLKLLEDPYLLWLLYPRHHRTALSPQELTTVSRGIRGKQEEVVRGHKSSALKWGLTISCVTWWQELVTLWHNQNFLRAKLEYSPQIYRFIRDDGY